MSNRIAAIKGRITRLRLKQVELAALSGLDKATVSTALAGKRDARNSTLEALEDALTKEEQKLAEGLPRHVGEAAE